MDGCKPLMQGMMKNISPDQLKEMSAASGMNMSDEQADQAGGLLTTSTRPDIGASLTFRMNDHTDARSPFVVA